MNEQKVRHGQAMVIQMVSFLLQKIILDIDMGGKYTAELLGNARSVGGQLNLKTYETGCTYVVNFLLPLTIELSLKSLILKEKKKPLKEHNLTLLFNQISESSQEMIEREYHVGTRTLPFKDCECVRKLFNNHKTDFEAWRYMDAAEKLSQREEIKLQYTISAILTVYENV
jgi:hypothetical protein